MCYQMPARSCRKFYMRIGTLFCGLIFLIGSQLFQVPAVDSSHPHLQRNDNVYSTVMYDAFLEEAGESEHRIILGIFDSTTNEVILNIFSSPLSFRLLPEWQSPVRTLHSSRAPPIV